MVLLHVSRRFLPLLDEGLGMSTKDFPSWVLHTIGKTFPVIFASVWRVENRGTSWRKMWFAGVLALTLAQHLVSYSNTVASHWRK